MKKLIIMTSFILLIGLGVTVFADNFIGSQSGIEYTEDNCLDGQNMNASDVDISNCPPIPEYPNDIKWPLQNNEEEDSVSLGAWELGMTVDGVKYKYGSLNDANEKQRVLNFYDEEDSANVDSININCWAKGYYRLRNILQSPPAEYIKLRNAGFQTRFFQFQTDLRNGDTGYKEISSYRDHLVKWVTVIDSRGQCTQPTLQKFIDYSKAELERREL